VAEESGHHCKLEGRMEKVEGSLSCYMREGIELKTEFKSLKDIVSDIRDSMKWISRTIIGSVIVALVTVTFALIKNM
jgi:hypothetical protein